MRRAGTDRKNHASCRRPNKNGAMIPGLAHRCAGCIKRPTALGSSDSRSAAALTGARFMSAHSAAQVSAAQNSDAQPAASGIEIGSLDLAALLCSRVCHDLISPVGAIVNGLEVMEDDNDPETKAFAMDLIKKSVRQASAKLQFCRLAFGAAGSAGAQIDIGDAEKVARGFLEDDKTKIAWNLPASAAPEEPREASAQHVADRRAVDPARWSDRCRSGW